MRGLAAALSFALVFAFCARGPRQQALDRAPWMEGMKTGLPGVFCQQGSYFRECFRISAEECEDTARSATGVCLTRFESEIPPVLYQPRDGSEWGKKVGRCAGASFEATWTEKKVTSAKCSDLSGWGYGEQRETPPGSH